MADDKRVQDLMEQMNLMDQQPLESGATLYTPNAVSKFKPYEELVKSYNDIKDPNFLQEQKTLNSNLNQTNLLANLAAAGSNIGASIAGAQKDTSFFDKLKKDSEQNYTNQLNAIKQGQELKQKNFDALRNIMSEQRAQKYLDIQQDQEDRSKKRFDQDMQESQLRYDKAKTEYQEELEKLDPNSRMSSVKREAIIKEFPELKGSVEGKSYKEMNELAAAMGGKFKRSMDEIDRQLKREQIQAQKELRLATLEEKKQAKETKQEEKLDKQVTNYSEALKKTNIPEMTDAVSQVQEILDKNTDDLPGYGATGFLPNFALSSKGKDLRQKVATLFNVTLKDRSGAAVTDQELERLKQEFGTGKWLTDDDLRRGVAAYVKRLHEVSRNTMAGVKPEAKSEYEERGGKDYEKILRQYAERKKSSNFTPAQEAGIKAVMDANQIGRDEAIKALKAAGKL